MSAQQAPNFSLAHVASGRQVSPGDYRGRTVVYLFAGRDSGDQAGQIAQTISGRYGPDQLPIVSVMDMHGVPRLVQGLAKGQIQKAYEEAVRQATAQFQASGRVMPSDPSQVVVMLPDWDGKVTSSFGLSGVDKQAVAVLVDGDGYVRGYGAGAQGGEQILSLFG